MYKTVIFDLDGTLLDTLDDLTSAVNAGLSAYGFARRKKEEVLSFIGNGIAKLMERAANFQGDAKALLTAFKAYYAVHCADQTKPYDGIIPLLKQLKEQGVKIGVLSNKADFAVKQLIYGYFGDIFDDVQGEDEEHGVYRKPNPSALLSMMERLNAVPSQTVYVGDSDVDIQTAKNAGVNCISVSWGFKKKEFLKEQGASVIVDSVEELLETLTRK